MLAKVASEIRQAPPTKAVESRKGLLDLLEQGSRTPDPMLLAGYIRAQCAAMAAHSRRKGVQ
jgi:hypothetical protein